MKTDMVISNDTRHLLAVRTKNRAVTDSDSDLVYVRPHKSIVVTFTHPEGTIPFIKLWEANVMFVSWIQKGRLGEN